MTKMTKKELIERIKDAPDDALILGPDHDHNYRGITPDVTTALQDGNHFTEDFGEDLTPESEHGKRVPVIVFA